MAINPRRDVRQEGICHTKSKLHKPPLENLFTKHCSLKASCTDRLNCHQVLICICTDNFKKNLGFKQLVCKVHFPNQMPVSLLKSVLTCKSKELNVDCHTSISQLLLSGFPVIVIQVTTHRNLLSDAMLTTGETSSQKKHITYQHNK